MRLGEVRAIVTGAARGLGEHFALELLRAGASVAAGDIDKAGLRRLKASARELPGKLQLAQLDVADENSVKAFVEQAEETLGMVNVLVNNAGILRDGLLARSEPGMTQGLPLPLWNKVLGVNLTGPFLMAREVALQMIKNQVEDGVLINISSLARAGNPGQGSYSASKSGLDACTRTWSLELAEHSIRVVGIAPGLIDTPIVEEISPEALDNLVESIPVGRVGRPQEVWQGVAFAIECGFFNGRVLEIDGGASMG